jgi:hypothetical protein
VQPDEDQEQPMQDFARRAHARAPEL